ncbi:MAG: LysM peptidoglycan-binding domain-containing protein, partial [Candidatus Rokuibacteriota bacterium]
MAIQSRFLVASALFLAVTASGSFVPVAVASFWPEAVDGPAPDIDYAAVPPPIDDAHPQPDPLVEHWLDGVGSVAEQEAASEIEQADVDPWADAFADSSRAAIVSAIAAKPAYPVSINPQVQYFLDRFTGARRDVVNLWVGRSGRYLGMIREVLRSRGLPEELAYTAMIESGFNPLAVSRVGAKGMWQFMAATARRYGLRVDRWIDERLDPEKSTVAAAAYLKDLYNIFGSWPLAQAAYNAGEMRVIRAIRATGSSDFWTLAQTRHLHPETKDFVPAIHAATLIAENATQYGFEFAEVDTPHVETVAVPPSTDLRRLASKAGIEPGELKVLNPVLVRAMTPPGDGWSLRVPPGTRSNVLTALAPPAPRATAARRAAATRPVGAREDVHVVRPRETVSSIAKQYGVAVADVLRWNRLEQRAHIRPG